MISSLARDPTANQVAQNPQPKKQLCLTKQQMGLQGPLDFGPQFINSGSVLVQKFLGSKWLLPRPRTGTEESGGPLLITVRTTSKRGLASTPPWVIGPTGNPKLSGALAAAGLAMSQAVSSGSSSSWASWESGNSWARAPAGSFVMCTCLLLPLPLAG